MQIKFVAAGLGVSIPYVGVGVNMITGVYIQLRNTVNDSPYVLGIVAGPELGDDSGTLFGSFIDSSWLTLNPDKHPWICSKTALIGKQAEISITGTLLLKGSADIKFSIFDNENEEEFSFEKVEVKTSGFQIADTRIRGKVVDMMGKMNNKILSCNK